jgi:hypothetical protein
MENNNIIMNTKTCRKCNITKDVSCFSKHSGTKDKLDNRCKECVKLVKKKSINSIEYPVYELDMDNKDWQLGKPTGTILERTSKYNTKFYEVRIPNKGKTLSKSFSFSKYKTPEEAYKDAKEYLYEKSTELGLTRNRIKVIDINTIEVEITQGYIMKTDMKFSDVVQKYTLISTKSGRETANYYVSLSINNKSLYFHKYITGYEMTDHIDRNPMNNVLSNLRETDHKLNNNNRSINKKILEENPNRVMGIRFNIKDEAWQARIKQDGKEYTKQFSVIKYGYYEAKELAIIAREELCEKFNSDNN